MKINKMNTILNILLFLFNPIFSMILNVFLFIKSKKKNILLLALSSAIFLSYFPPLFDNIHTYSLYKTILEVKTIKGFFEIPNIDTYYFLPFYLGNKIGLEFWNIVFLYVFTIIFLWFSSYEMINKSVGLRVEKNL